MSLHELTDEQREIRELARRFADEVVAPQAPEWDREHRFPLEVVSRDDNGAPGDAVRAAEELVSREGVVLLTGGFLSHVGLAVADFAKQRKMPFIASEPLTDKIVWENGNAYTFRLRASTYMQTSMLVEEAVKLNKKRWALVYPNYEYGQSAINSFKQLMTARQPGVEFVVEQAPPLNRIDAGSVAAALPLAAVRLAGFRPVSLEDLSALRAGMVVTPSLEACRPDDTAVEPRATGPRAG